VGRVAAARHEEYAQERRDTILNAALRVFAQTGFAEAKMEEVAAAANLSKAALYLYFPSKEALLRSLLERYTLLPELPARLAALRDIPPTVAIPNLVGEIWQRLRERKELARVIVREIQSNPERAKLLTEQAGMPVFQSLAGYLEHWMKRGVLKSQHAFATAQCLFGMLWFFLLNQELSGGKQLYPLSDETIVNTVARTFLDGVAKPARHSAQRVAADRRRH
jgi:AcrR family transcriptional regulator